MSYKKLVLALVSVLVFSLLLAIPVIGAAGFVKYAGNPVLVNDFTYDNQLAGSSCVILDGATYKMWYTGYNGSGFSICYATSPDGISWSKNIADNLALSPGPSGAWDDFILGAPCVIKDGGGSYKMWYTGSRSDLKAQIGYATSFNGIVWTKYGTDAVLKVGAASWDRDSVAFPSVINDGGVYKMWYTGQDKSIVPFPGELAIGYATSANGYDWTKELTNPRLSKSLTATDFDGRAVLACSVIKEGSAFYMYYTGLVYSVTTGNQARIGSAFSTDGIVWTKTSPSPVLDVGISGSWDEKGVAAPSVLQVNNITKMWYTGGNNSLDFKIGYAEYIPEPVPASSNLTTAFIIGGIAVLMAVVLWGTRRFQHRSR
jgi:beta-1,2-mannobiose phosphorylase / 1,2-beta-oligomannan phosphorylase